MDNDDDRLDECGGGLCHTLEGPPFNGQLAEVLMVMHAFVLIS